MEVLLDGGGDLRDQADAFERTMLSMETQLRRAQTAAEEARAKAEVDIADAKRERETFKAESRAASQRETSAMRTEIDALKLSLGDSNSSDALVQSAAALAAAKAALAATEQRLADQEAHDAETIADLRTRLNEKKRECDDFVGVGGEVTDLTPAQHKEFQALEHQVERLTTAILRLDETIMVLRDGAHQERLFNQRTKVHESPND